MLLLQALNSLFTIHLNVIIALYIFSDGLLYVKILEHFNLMLDQFHCANALDLV